MRCLKSLVITSESNEAFVEFANIITGGSIGQIGITSTTTYTNLTYTPNPNDAVQVRTFGIEQKIFSGGSDYNTQMLLNNHEYVSGTGLYRGTKLDLRTTLISNMMVFLSSGDSSLGSNPLHSTLITTFSSLRNTSL